MTTSDLCALLRVSPNRVYQWRVQGTGPKAIKVGGTLRWRRGDVDEWLESKSGNQSNRFEEQTPNKTATAF